MVEIPEAIANRVSNAILWTPIVRIAADLWLSTVLGVMPKIIAASATEHPNDNRRNNAPLTRRKDACIA